ncbi:MAG: tRNA (guanosine(46)-N7)-methyltransferase TrmB [Clostridia bacterium]|nr:tRNA (guanosine(46)-N7)-methyltransferase TrmB [Clostridia bacterium]
MRRKKHLTERLNSVSDYIIVADKKFTNVKEALEYKRLIDFSKVFNNDNKVCLEIGCGKGRFICETAKKFSNLNFLAVELLENIIVTASEKAKKENLSNVRFLNTGVEYLLRYIPEGSIDKIFLNFSPPYPAKSYENRRFTNDRNIASYKKMLNNCGEIYQKTDDKEFFLYSKEKLSDGGFTVLDISDCYLKNEYINVKTEYEEKFLNNNIKINALVAKKN